MAKTNAIRGVKLPRSIHSQLFIFEDSVTYTTPACFRLPRSLSTRLPLALLALAGTLLPLAGAQVQFSGTLSPIGGGYNQPADIAVDTSGNAYLSVFGSNQQLKETLQPDGSYVESVLTNGVDFSWGIALDQNGDVLIPSLFSNSVVQLRPSGSKYLPTILSLNAGVSPAGIAVDQNGTLYVASTGSNAVYKETLHGSTYTQTPIVTGLGNPGPYGVAVDPNGVVYIADTGDNQVLVETPSGTGYTQTTLSSGLSAPYGVASDMLGNIYIADSGNNRILKETWTGSAFVESTLGTELSHPEGLSVDGNGNLYIANNGAGNFVELHIASVPFGSQAVRSAGNTIALPFTIAAGTTIGNISILTTGTAGLDFADGGGSTCTAQSYDSDTTCVVNVNFSPLVPGLRRGAVVLSDGSGNVLATVPLYGAGTGPQVVYGQGVLNSVSTGLSNPTGVAVDDAGDVFITVTGNSNVLKVTPGGTQTTVGTGFPEPTGVAVDGVGNVYIADSSNQAVYQVTPAGIQTQIGSGFVTPFAVAVDVSGNVFVTDIGVGLIYRVTPAGIESAFGTGNFASFGITTDAAGNAYFTNIADGKIYEVTPGGTLKTLAKGFLAPTGIALDAAGNLYVADLSFAELFEVRPGGVPTPIASGLADPYSLALDKGGNVYFSSASTNSVIQMVRTTPPVLAFAETLGGQTSTDSPKTVSLQNIGNLPLTFSAITYPIDFPRAASAGSYCRTTSLLAIGASCAITAKFAPVTPVAAGNLTVPLSEGVSITSNTLNTPGTQQTLSVSGTEDMNVTATPTFSAPAGAYNSAQSISITDTTPGAIIYYTRNGRTPSSTAGIKYSGPVTVRGSATIQAIAYAPGFLPGSVASASYSFVVADPVLSLAGGTYSGAQTVTVTSATPTATIYYTTNGRTPATNSTKYTGPITVSASETLTVVALETNFTSSSVVQASYTIQP